MSLALPKTWPPYFLLKILWLVAGATLSAGADVLSALLRIDPASSWIRGQQAETLSEAKPLRSARSAKKGHLYVAFSSSSRRACNPSQRASDGEKTTPRRGRFWRASGRCWRRRVPSRRRSWRTGRAWVRGSVSRLLWRACLEYHTAFSDCR